MAMITNFSTLTVKFNAVIESPPVSNREHFRQCVISTLLSVLKTQGVAVEYIGYRPDPVGIHRLDTTKTEYEDSVFASLSLNHNSLLLVGQADRKEDLVRAFVETFESTTHRHLEVEYIREDAKSHDIEIEMSSDWKLYLKQGWSHKASYSYLDCSKLTVCTMFRFLAKLNRLLLPSLTHRRLDLAKASKFQKALIAWRYYVTTRALEENK